MFGKSDTLPMHGGNRRVNGISGMPVIDKGVALSILWVIVSFAIIFAGYTHCKSYAYKYSLTCNDGQCTWTALDNNFLQYSERYNNNPAIAIKLNTISFPKHDLLDAEMVRIDDDGNFADATSMKADKKKRFGYSIRMRVRQPPEPGSRLKVEKHMMFLPYDLGRRSARSGAKQLDEFIESSEKKDLTYVHSRNVTFIGVMAILSGIASMVLAVIFGRWSEQPRRSKKSS